MKLGYLLLYELAEAGRNWSLVNNMRMRSLLIKGGRKLPKGYEKSKKDIREQARSFPFCTSGSPAVDDCYRRCVGKAKNPGIVDCSSTQELYTIDGESYQNCRKKSHSTEKDNCVKIAPGNDNLEDVINFNGEREGWYFHHTTEIEAPYGKFIQLEVKDFHIGNKTLDSSKLEEDCGYGSIYVFTGVGRLSAMQKVIEFCGSTDQPVVDFKNLLYPGETPERAVPVVIPNNRAIIAVTTQERFNEETIGRAQATISWKIVDAPHSQLILQPEFFQYELIRKFARAACLDLAGHVESEEKGVCKFKQEGKKRWIQRFVDRFEAMIADVFLKNHQHCFTDGDAFRFQPDEPTIERIGAMQNMNDAFVVGKSYIQRVAEKCQFGIFWDARMNKIRKKLSENTATKIPACTMGALCNIGDLS